RRGRPWPTSAGGGAPSPTSSACSDRRVARLTGGAMARRRSRWTLAVLAPAVAAAAWAGAGGAAAPVPAAAHPAAQPAVVDVPAGIDATGRQDVTEALNDLIAGAPDGAVIRFPAGARYRAEGPIVVRDRVGLTLAF